MGAFDLCTAGADAPYARLFLNPAVLALTPAFADDGFGALPGQPATPLLDAAEALRAAFGLSGDEFALLAGHLGYGATTPLTLGNISRLARHIWLSRQLRISLREFLELMAMTGIDPFAPPDPGATVPADGPPAIPAAAYNVASALIALEQGVGNASPRARVHVDGAGWLILEAARMSGTGSPSTDDDIAVTVSPTLMASVKASCIPANMFPRVD